MIRLFLMARRLVDLATRPVRPALARDAGMTTVEYAMGTMAAAAIAGVLYKVVTSDMVHDALGEVVTSALNLAM